MLWKRKKSAVPGKNEDQEKTAENLMTQIIKDLNEKLARTEEPVKIEENPNKNPYKNTEKHGGFTILQILIDKTRGPLFGVI
jgi:hypothetical protein